jgi:hypothetical protein
VQAQEVSLENLLSPKKAHTQERMRTSRILPCTLFLGGIKCQGGFLSLEYITPINARSTDWVEEMSFFVRPKHVA